MAMSKEECLHDCTCCAEKDVTVRSTGQESLLLHFKCDLPDPHAGQLHWDPVYGEFE